MIKRIFLLIVLLVLLLNSNSSTAFADDVGPGGICRQGMDVCTKDAKGDIYDCLPSGTKDVNGNDIFQCQPSTVGKIFGKIQPPAPLAGLLKTDPTGAGAISQFLSNLVVLIFSAAAIVLIFMLLWGAFDWMISEGDKEKVASAQKKIVNALIGIVLFAIAFAVIRALGAFTGFTFFKW